ncbi:conserved hypothetical protein [Gammaproteobacteria bacterium]
MSRVPAIWFPTIRAGSGSDVFTMRLVDALNNSGIRAEITWFSHRAEYAPWTVPLPTPPSWANIAHVNSWLPRRFLPRNLPILVTAHHCVLDPALRSYKSFLQSLYHQTWIRFLEQRNLDHATRISTVSQYTEKSIQSVYQCRTMEVIPNSVDLTTFKSISRQHFHTPFRLLFVGNWSRRKGADLLFPILKSLGNNFELWILAGPRASEVSILEKNVRILPRCKDDFEMVTLYQNCDALLFPSRLEGFGLAVLEAQACGLPVITTDGSALPEVIEDGVTGFLCPQDDVIAFSEAVQRLALDLVLWKDMCAAARKRVEIHFDPKIILGSYLSLYQSILTECT